MVSEVKVTVSYMEVLFSSSSMPSFKPPQQFNFLELQCWPEWRSQFKRYGTASDLTDKSGKVQVSSLIYSTGPEALYVVRAEHLTVGAK